MASSGDIYAAGLWSSDHAVPGASNSTEVSELLTSLNLQQYIGVFAANDINNISTLNEMQDAHFRMLDASIGHQLDIVRHARSRSDVSNGACARSARGRVSRGPARRIGDD